MTILLTGSAGKTAAALADALSPENNILVASRRPSPDSKYPIVQFDWLNDSTWPNAFSHPQAKDSPISAVYLVVADFPEARANAIPFVRFCVERGVRRFVLLSAWENAEGGSLLGGVHAELKGMGQKEGIEWAVLRPHFFMCECYLMHLDKLAYTGTENFIETYHLDTIKNERKIYSGAGNGSKPFIAARDIAAVARRAILDAKSPNRDYILTSPESLTYTDVANILSDVLDTKIEHVSLDPDAFQAKLSGFGMTAEMAEYMTNLDVRVSQGLGKEVSGAVREVTGSQPQTFRQFAEANKSKWL